MHRLRQGELPGAAGLPLVPRMDVETINLSRRGRVVTSTVVRTPPDDLLMEAPYAMAVVETPEGARFMTQAMSSAPGHKYGGIRTALHLALRRCSSSK